MIYGCLRIFKRYKEAARPQQKGNKIELDGQKTKGIQEQRVAGCCKGGEVGEWGRGMQHLFASGA